MEEKRLKEQIKDVKKSLKAKRKLFSIVALSHSLTDLKTIDELREDIIVLERKLSDLEGKYKK